MIQLQYRWQRHPAGQPVPQGIEIIPKAVRSTGLFQQLLVEPGLLMNFPEIKNHSQHLRGSF
ncbi:hypothetical protein HA49_11830 [Tatumella morbirosei]|uniref:Uncharacterized protein n=1 Tax=Tatumella morbirosei TaxID=642227 RepID=A0A095T7M9_9GAMM|nr:hypothetical protein HA49_11830 [Tatumella morbirosei]